MQIIWSFGKTFAQEINFPQSQNFTVLGLDFYFGLYTLQVSVIITVYIISVMCLHNINLIIACLHININLTIVCLHNIN